MKEKEVKEENNIEENAKEVKNKFDFLKKKEIWISGAIGLVLGGILIYILGIMGLPGLGHEAIVRFKGGRVTKNKAYNEIEKYSISYILELADKSILNNMYKLTDEQKKEIEEKIDSILNTYKAYGYTEEQFLNENGFGSKEDFESYMELDYKRNLYCIDYFKTLIPSEKIENYYNDNVYGEINTKHILVKLSDEMTEEKALKTANEILSKLKSGKSFDDVANEYKDKVITENVDFDYSTESSLAEEYVAASKALEKDNYTTKAVKTEFGYHIIYCINKADKPALEEVEKGIIEILAKDLEKEDQYIRAKALLKLREDKKVKFGSKDLQKEYEEYCNQLKNVTSKNTKTDQ